MGHAQDARFPALFKFKEIDIAALGDNAVVAAVPGKSLRVVGYLMTSVLAVDARFKQNPSGVVLSGAMSLPVNGRVEYPGSVLGPAFETAIGQGIDLNLTVATGVRGHLTYQEIN